MDVSLMINRTKLKGAPMLSDNIHHAKTHLSALVDKAQAGEPSFADAYVAVYPCPVMQV